MDTDDLPPALRNAVLDELDPGEGVRWVGQPSAGRFAVWSIPTALMGVFVAGFALFWMSQAFWITGKHREMEQRHADFDRRWNEDRARMNGPDPWGRNPQPAPLPPPAPAARDDRFSFRDLFPLFGLIFLVAGIGMILSPLWAAYKASNTVYLVTDRRAVIFDGGWSTHVRSFAPADLGSIERRQRGDGSGDIILAKEPVWVAGHYSGTPGRGGHHVPGHWTTREIGFFGVPDVKYVESLLRGLAAGTGPAA